jgi:hypothetical protein
MSLFISDEMRVLLEGMGKRSLVRALHLLGLPYEDSEEGYLLAPRLMEYFCTLNGWPAIPQPAARSTAGNEIQETGKDKRGWFAKY